MLQHHTCNHAVVLNISIADYMQPCAYSHADIQSNSTLDCAILLNYINASLRQMFLLLESNNALTTELAQGKNMPRQNKPSRGPPTIPKILSAA